MEILKLQIPKILFILALSVHSSAKGEETLSTQPQTNTVNSKNTENVDVALHDSAKTLRQMHMDLLKHMPDAKILIKYAENETELDHQISSSEEFQIVLVKNDRK